MVKGEKWGNRRKFLATVTGALGLWALKDVGIDEALSAQKRLPNILFIAADDLGYAELGVQGCKDIPTPNIDSIAQNGIRFTDGYVSCPVCAPTRAGWITGKYQQRFGFEFNPGGASQEEFGLPTTELTIAERLKKLGYATGCFGKWHLGFRKELHPLNRGFDEFYGFLGGGHPYLPASGRSAIMRGFEPVTKFEFTTMDFAKEAISFIERHRNQPFFRLPSLQRSPRSFTSARRIHRQVQTHQRPDEANFCGNAFCVRRRCWDGAFQVEGVKT
jgi:arylsulfatase A-like enzyme